MQLSSKVRNQLAFAIVLATGATLAACGGGGGSSVGGGPNPTSPTPTPTPTSAPSGTSPTPPPTIAPSSPPTATPSPVPTSTFPTGIATPTPPPSGDTNLIFRLGIPDSSKYDYEHQRRQFYISPGSQSLGVVDTLNNSISALFPLGTPANPEISPSTTCQNTQTTYYCQVYETLPDGTYDFAATLYPTQNGTGTALSIGNTGSIQLNGNNQTQSLLMEAVVNSIVLALQTANPPAGKPIYDTLHVTLIDSAGDVIASDSQYNPSEALYNPVTITSSNPKDGPLSSYVLPSICNGTSCSVAVQAEVSGIYVTYDGAKVGPITYSATAAGVSPSNVTNAILTP